MYIKYDFEKLKFFLEEYLMLKGINPDKEMKCFSKDHEDKNPSMFYSHQLGMCKCFACGEVYNIFKLVGEEYNLKTFKEQIAKVNELYNNKELIQSANDTIYSKKNGEIILDTELKSKIIKIAKKEEKKYPELYYYYRDCKNNLKTSNIDYLQKRGISKKVADYYNLGYDPNCKPYEKMKNTIQAIIFPVSENSYTARNINAKDKNFRYLKVGNQDIFNLWEVKLKENKGKDFFVVEGEIDALSLAEVGKKAIALRSTTNINNVVNSLKEIKQENRFILMLDNDEAGQKAQQELFTKMKKENMNVSYIKLPNEIKDPNEFLVKNREKFEKFVNNKWLIKNNELNKGIER